MLLVRFFLPVPFFFDRTTLIVSAGLSSSASSYSWNELNRGVPEPLGGVSAGVDCIDTGRDVFAPTGISPFFSIVNEVEVSDV